MECLSREPVAKNIGLHQNVQEIQDITKEYTTYANTTDCYQIPSRNKFKNTMYTLYNAKLQTKTKMYLHSVKIKCSNAY